MFKKHLLGITFLVTLFTATGSYSQTTNIWPDFYNQAPTIKIKDPMAVLVGSLPEDQNTLIIHLTDIALYSGHVCPGIASGYMLTRKALQALYPEGVPERGQIRVAAMGPSDLMDVASYITGARSFYGRDEINAYDLVVDTNLKPQQAGTYVIVFQRKDNGQAVKAVFNKFKLMAPGKVKNMKNFFKRVLEGKASAQEKTKKWAKVQSLVKKILLNTPEGLIEITPLKKYDFPESAK